MSMKKHCDICNDEMLMFEGWKATMNRPYLAFSIDICESCMEKLRKGKKYEDGYADGYEDGYDAGCMDMVDEDLGADKEEDENETDDRNM